MQDLQTFFNVREMLADFLLEDIGTEDITSNKIIPNDLFARAQIICKSCPAIVCGLEEAAIIFEICGCTSEILTKDGSRVKKRRVVMKVSGNARAILRAERVALNIIMRMSGIATETGRMGELAKGVKILATRKTAAGLRYFDKKAVVVGGGGTHRMRLDDMVLIKDNHIALSGPAEKCVSLAKKNIGSSIRIECETKNMKEAFAAISAGADIIMLDNFTPREAANTIRQIAKMGMRKKVKIEISGGINANNIRQFAQAKPDFISLGYITHSPKAIDFSLEIMK
ncbi:MAG TPA: carboxylating nicotinate-nucleotide diphosphorylase [Nitrososphaera sp.]|nr:carboxylating nicotinate-nucleotide diphosphorylase [Nitrososphaera sp.]